MGVETLMTLMDVSAKLVADSLIPKYGKAAVLTTKSGGTFKPDEGAYSSPTTSTTNVLVTPPSGRKFWPGSMSSTAVQGSMITYVRPVQGVNIVQGSTLTIDTDVWTITEVEPVYSGELVVLYGLTIKR